DAPRIGGTLRDGREKLRTTGPLWRDHDERVRSAEFKHRFLQGASRRGGDGAAGARAAGERDGADGGMLDHFLRRVVVEVEVREDAGREAGLQKDTFDPGGT